MSGINISNRNIPSSTTEGLFIGKTGNKNFSDRWKYKPTDTIISLPIKSSLTRPDVNSAGPCSIWAVWKYEVAIYPCRRSGNKFYGDQIPYTPQHSGSILLWGTWKRWNLNYSFIYTGERYSNSENIPVNYLQPWYTSDIALSHTFSIKKVGFKAACEVSNLFNQHYDVIVNYPMPGTNFKITLTIQI